MILKPRWSREDHLRPCQPLDPVWRPVSLTFKDKMLPWFQLPCATLTEGKQTQQIVLEDTLISSPKQNK